MHATSTPAAVSRGSEAAIVGGCHGVVEISKLDVPSGLRTRYNRPDPTGTQIQRVKNKGALPAGRYTGRARRTNALVVGQQDSGGRTDLVIVCDRSYPKHA